MLFGNSSKIEYILVGLGNPGKKYEGSRHNAGFDAIDYMAQKYGVKIIKARFDALTGTGSIDGHGVLFLKPQTFMNLSGVAVQKAAAYYKIAPQNVIIMFDDVSLSPGKIRVRREGSAGGHNGIKSIIENMDKEFPRVKIGVGAKPHPDYDLADWVLGHFTDGDKKCITSRYDDICAAVELIMKGQYEAAMSKYNG